MVEQARRVRQAKGVRQAREAKQAWEGQECETMKTISRTAMQETTFRDALIEIKYIESADAKTKIHSTIVQL